ncbi:hypothetical protein TL16_g12583 [Triparma laevis f. inornata]|uniref:Uncharacterized protein n=2 Tax=Triparma laevis TaxID=1534972 RepID=A0A9W7FU01_9STRA|nr:hypothetical protein TL16_g12583 [Triparma laevis f. inornata]GMI17918.1 hypothetical protein TrLO_g2892 [Triparma laevis f. longispina]
MASLTVTAAEKKRHELQKKLKERQGDDVPTLTSEDITALTSERLNQIKSEEARLEKKGPWDENTKSFKGAIGDDSVKATPIKLCKAANMETEGSMNNAEKAKLAAMVGNAHAQSMKAYSNQEGVTTTITETSTNAQTTLVFNACCDSKYTLESYVAKIFVQNCENVEITLAPSSKVLTETVEVHRCVSTNLVMKSRVSTLQIDQSSDCKLNFEKVENFGNPSMIRKGREFGKDGRVVWAGCENLNVIIGEDKVTADFETEKATDATCNEERTQFKVSYDSLGVIRSEKVVRLRNGFPSTKREDDEHDRREEEALQGLAERMGVTLNRKEENVGKKCKPNELCHCGSGKKFKKCCGSN